MWITDQAGNVRARKMARPGQKMVNEAGQFLTEHGFARTGNYMLVAEGSPMRRATLVPSSTYGQRGRGAVLASAVSRVLNEKFPFGRFVVKQRGDQVLVLGPRDHDSVRWLNAKGYRVEPQTNNELLVTGKVDG
ncbi:MAG: hypothetical protein E6R04_08705 [Spirochaetes bacterium]|nr:MAG: hypothetical protein E6R04_08705 [Spirochaetota bacterium]